MTLNREKFNMLKSIVGPDNISDDPAMMDGYIWHWRTEMYVKKPYLRFSENRPVAVVMPETTEEVQQIVKACNRHDLKFRAMSTGWGPWNAPINDNVVQLDMRRMNRIREFNEKDMYAVVEPYVIWAQLQVEAMQRGLNCNIIGAGSNTSPLASCTSMEGFGSNGPVMGHNSRNILGLECVLPNGELMKVGSLGSGMGWFSGDGPGPSLRGILRGAQGALGSFGVFTAAAVRLYQWGGPAAMPSKNLNPYDEELLEWPENTEIYWLYFEDKEQRDAMFYRIGEAEISYGSTSLAKGLATISYAPTSKAAVELRENMFDALPHSSFIVLLVGNSKDELAYQKKVMEKLMKEHNAQNFPMIEDPMVKGHMALMLIKVGTMAAAGTFGKSGAFVATVGGSFVARRHFTELEQLSHEIKLNTIKTGKIVDDGGEGGWGMLMDQGHQGYFEDETLYQNFNKESTDAMIEMIKEQNRQIAEKKMSYPAVAANITAAGRGLSLDDHAGPELSNYHVWLRKIRKSFNPNNTSDE